MEFFRKILWGLGSALFCLAVSAHAEDRGIFERRYFPSLLRSASCLAEELEIAWPNDLPKMIFSQKLTLDGERFRCHEGGIEFARKVSDQTILWAVVSCQNLSSKTALKGIAIKWSDLDLGKTDYGITRNKSQLDQVKNFVSVLSNLAVSTNLSQKVIRISGESSTPQITRDELRLPIYLNSRALENMLDAANQIDLYADFSMPMISKKSRKEYQEKINVLMETLAKNGPIYVITMQKGSMQLNPQERSI